MIFEPDNQHSLASKRWGHEIHNGKLVDAAILVQRQIQKLQYSEFKD